jgi:hypothetical protein
VYDSQSQPAKGSAKENHEHAMTINIEPIEVDGQHWVNVTIGGSEMERRGPFPTPTPPRAWPNACAV